MDNNMADNENINKFLDDFQSFTRSWYPYIISLIIAVITGIRMYAAGPKCPSINRIDNKTVLITGGSSGIGFQTARELLMRGANIILACRNNERAEKARNQLLTEFPTSKIDIKLVDMSLMTSVRKFAREIERQYDKIDILINNAGVTYHPQPPTPEGFEVTFATNYLGPFLLTHLLLPLINASQNGRIINLVALAHFSVTLSLNDLPPETITNSKEIFGKSKLALMCFTKHMGRICRNLKVNVNAVNPGIVRNTKHLDDISLNSNFFTRFSIAPWTWLFLKTPNQGCQTVVYCAVDATLDVTTSAYFSDCEQQDSAPFTKNYTFAADFYNKTCEILDINSAKLIEDLTQPI